MNTIHPLDIWIPLFRCRMHYQYWRLFVQRLLKNSIKSPFSLSEKVCILGWFYFKSKVLNIGLFFDSSYVDRNKIIVSPLHLGSPEQILSYVPGKFFTHSALNATICGFSCAWTFISAFKSATCFLRFSISLNKKEKPSSLLFISVPSK